MRRVILSARPPDALPGSVLTLSRRAALQLGARPLRLAEYALRLVQQAGIEVASPALSQRLLTASVRQVLDVREPGLTARTSINVVRELLRTGADLSDLTQSSSRRIAQLARLTAQYQAELARAQVIDPAQVNARATELVKPHLLSLTGYPRILPDEQQFLDAACADGSVIHLPWADHPYFRENEQAADFFASRGWQVEKVSSELTGLPAAFLGQGTGEGTLHVLANEDGEVRAALGQIKGLLLAGTPPSDIALVVNDDERWAGLVDAVAREYGVPIRFGTSVAAAQTRLGRWLLRVLQVSEEEYSLESVARLLAHPLEQRLDGATWRALRQQAPQNLNEWRETGVNLSGLLWSLEATRREWVGHLLNLFETRGVSERATHGTDLLALNFVRAELAVLAAPPQEQVSRAQFFEELRELLGLVTVPTHLSRAGVELLTPPSLLGASIPHVFFLGLSDGGLPAALQDDPVLDFLERKRLAELGLSLDTAASMSRRDAVIFWSALQASGEATFSYARLTGSGLPSPYLAPLGLRETPPPHFASSPEEARRFALRGPAEYLDAQLAETRRRHGVEVQRLSSPTYSEFDGMGLPVYDPQTRVFSPSQLSTLGRCGFRWWLECGLELVDEEHDRSALDLGTLRHEVLRRAAQRTIGNEEDVREVMLTNLEEDWQASEEALGWPQSPAWDRERPEHLAALRRAVQQPDFVRSNARPLELEKKFEGVWLGFQIRGRVDRVDNLGGKALIVDYKSGASKPLGVQDSEGQLKLDIQLPIYVQTALPILYPEMKGAGAYYLSLKNGKQLDQLKINMTEYEGLAERLKAMLRAGHYVPRPDAARQACQQCAWSFVCRGGQRLERKERV